MKLAVFGITLFTGITLTGPSTAGVNVAPGAKLTVDGVLTTDTLQASGGATLAGNGSVSGDVIIDPGATIAPGDSVGTLVAGPDLTINGTYQCDLAVATSSDSLVATGILDISGASLNFSVGAPLTAPAYVIASYNSLVGTEFASVNNLPANYQLVYGYSDVASSNNIAVVMTPYAIWALARGLDLETNSGFNDDPNLDGVSNLSHYAFDTDPQGGATATNKFANQIIEDGGQRYFVLTLPVRYGAVFSGSPLESNNAEGVIYSIVGDADLVAAWNLDVVEITPALATALPALGNYDGLTGADWEYRSFRLSDSIDTLSRAFMRAEASAAP